MSTREQQTQIFDHYYDYEGDYEINDETDLMDQSYSTDSYLDSSKNSSKSNESIDEVDDANNHWHRRRHKFSPIPRKRRQFPSNLHTCTTDVVKKKEVHIFNQQQNKKGDFTKTHIYYKEVSTLKKTNHPKEIGLISKIILILFLILLSIFVTYTYVMPTTTNTDLIIVNNRKLCNLSRIESKFPNQNQKLWRAIKIGIETTINDDPTKPSVYLFVYNDGKTVSRFMEQIIYLARNCMETSIDPIVLSRNDLSGIEMKNDYGVVIAEYQSKLLNSGVLLVNDLDQVGYNFIIIMF